MPTIPLLDVEACFAGLPVMAAAVKTVRRAGYPTPQPMALACCLATARGEPYMHLLAGAGGELMARRPGRGGWLPVPLPAAPLARGQPKGPGATLAGLCLLGASPARPLVAHGALGLLATLAAWGWASKEEATDVVESGGVACTRYGLAVAKGMPLAHLAALPAHGLWATKAGFSQAERAGRAAALRLPHWPGPRTPRASWAGLGAASAGAWPAGVRGELASESEVVATLATTTPPARPYVALWGMYLWDACKLGNPATPRTFTAKADEILVDLHGGRVVQIDRPPPDGRWQVLPEAVGLAFIGEEGLAPGGALVEEGLAGLRQCWRN